MGFKKTKKIYDIRSDMRSLQLKFYAEQCTDYDGDDIRTLQRMLKRIKRIERDKWLAWGIIHDSDTKGDNFFDPSVEKPHIHIWIICKKGYSTHKRIEFWFKKLSIQIREEDEGMWQHGIDRVGNPAGCALYATHETDEAIKDGKHKYSIDQVVTNDRTAYMQLRNHGAAASIRVRAADWAAYDEEAYSIGLTLGSWNQYYDLLPRSARENKNKIRIVKEQYDKGVFSALAQSNHVSRCAIFIQGQHNLGKSYAIKSALSQYNNLDVSNGRTGQFDRVDLEYDAIFVNDSRIPADAVIALSSDEVANVYHRNKDNGFFKGKYFIVTSNLDFRKWALDCGIDAGMGDFMPEEYQALQSRFFICKVEKKDGITQLICTNPTTRGSAKELEYKKHLYIEFRDQFNATIAEYKPHDRILTCEELNQHTCRELTPAERTEYNILVANARQIELSEVI